MCWVSDHKEVQGHTVSLGGFGLWGIPRVKKFSDFGRLQQEVDRAVMTGLTEEAIIWLRRRIRRNPNYLGERIG